MSTLDYVGEFNEIKCVEVAKCTFADRIIKGRDNKTGDKLKQL